MNNNLNNNMNGNVNGYFNYQSQGNTSIGSINENSVFSNDTFNNSQRHGDPKQVRRRLERRLSNDMRPTRDELYDRGIFRTNPADVKWWM